MIWAHILSAHIIFYFESLQGKNNFYAHWIALIAKIFVQIIAQVFQGNVFWLFFLGLIGFGLKLYRSHDLLLRLSTSLKRLFVRVSFEGDLLHF